MPWIAPREQDAGAQRASCAPRDHDIASVPEESRYESRFSDWYTAAAVRTRPPLELTTDGTFLCFPPELAPVMHHRAVRALDPRMQRELLMQHLFSYLTFTDRLEDEVVNRSARRIATAAIDLDVSQSMRLDAYKIYCDEGYHSLFSADLTAQLSARSGFVYDGGSGHPALAYFHEQRASLDGATRRWFD